MDLIEMKGQLTGEGQRQSFHPLRPKPVRNVLIAAEVEVVCVKPMWGSL